MNTNLYDTYIDDTYPGLLHAGGEELPSAGQADIYDGNGNKTSLKLGRACNGATICGDLTVDNLYFSGVSFLDKVYPIGAIYFSANALNPASLLGGTWLQVGQGKFVAGVGTGIDKNSVSYTVTPGDGDSTGEYTHTLTVAELAEHEHSPLFTANSEDDNPDLNNPTTSLIGNNIAGTICEDSLSYAAAAGSSLPHNNAPPSFGLYIFQRTA